MNRRRARAACLALALAGALLRSTPALADAREDKFAQGTAAFTDSRLEEALGIFQDMWKTAKTYDLAVMLARTERHLGKHDKAAEHYTYALDHFPLSGEEDLRADITAELAEVKKQVGALKIRVPVKDAAVKVNDAALDAALLGKDLFVMPGKVVIEASAPGYQSSRRTLEIKAGGEEDITLTLSPEQAAPRSKIPAFVAGGVGVAGVVAGAILVGLAEGKKSEALTLHEEIGSVAGCNADPVKCKALRDATSATDALGNGGIAAFVLGGLAGAGAVGYILLPTRAGAPKPPGKVAVVPVFGASSGGLVFSGSF